MNGISNPHAISKQKSECVCVWWAEWSKRAWQLMPAVLIDVELWDIVISLLFDAFQCNTPSTNDNTSSEHRYIRSLHFVIILNIFNLFDAPLCESVFVHWFWIFWSPSFVGRPWKTRWTQHVWHANWCWEIGLETRAGALDRCWNIFN